MITIHFSDASAFPDFRIDSASPVSQAFLDLGLSGFRAAALHVRSMPYWKNADAQDVLSVLKEGHGTCVSKHNILAELGRENGFPVYRFEGVYYLNNTIVAGVSDVLNRYGLQEIPRTHCFLECCGEYYDLTDGNCTGKLGLIRDYLRIEQVGISSGNAVLMKFMADYRVVNESFKHLSDDDFLRILNECSEYNFGLCDRGSHRRSE